MRGSSAAWFLGWAFWCGTMAFAQRLGRDPRRGPAVHLNGVALLATFVVFCGDFTGATKNAYIGYVRRSGCVMTVVMAAAATCVQERRQAGALA